MSKFKVSIVIPAKNEEAQILNTIEGAVSALAFFKIEGNIIAINDGSHDRTGEILTNLQSKYSNLQVIYHNESRGLGASFMEGVKLSQMDYVFLLPGDNENDPMSVLRHVHSIETEELLIAYVENKQARDWYRQIVSRTYTFIINKSFGKNLKYFNGTSIYKVKNLQVLNIQSKGFFFSAEILLKMLKKKNSYREVSIKLTNVKQTSSSAVSINSLKEVVFDYFYMLNWYYNH